MEQKIVMVKEKIIGMSLKAKDEYGNILLEKSKLNKDNYNIKKCDELISNYEYLLLYSDKLVNKNDIIINNIYSITITKFNIQEINKYKLFYSFIKLNGFKKDLLWEVVYNYYNRNVNNYNKINYNKINSGLVDMKKTFDSNSFNKFYFEIIDSIKTKTDLYKKYKNVGNYTYYFNNKEIKYDSIEYLNGTNNKKNRIKGKDGKTQILDNNEKYKVNQYLILNYNSASIFLYGEEKLSDYNDKVENFKRSLRKTSKKKITDKNYIEFINNHIGWSINDIAINFGVSYKTISRIVNENDIKMKLQDKNEKRIITTYDAISYYLKPSILSIKEKINITEKTIRKYVKKLNLDISTHAEYKKELKKVQQQNSAYFKVKEEIEKKVEITDEDFDIWCDGLSNIEEIFLSKEEIEENEKMKKQLQEKYDKKLEDEIEEEYQSWLNRDKNIVFDIDKYFDDAKKRYLKSIGKTTKQIINRISKRTKEEEEKLLKELNVNIEHTTDQWGKKIEKYDYGNELLN